MLSVTSEPSGAGLVEVAYRRPHGERLGTGLQAGLFGLGADLRIHQPLEVDRRLTWQTSLVGGMENRLETNLQFCYFPGYPYIRTRPYLAYFESGNVGSSVGTAALLEAWHARLTGHVDNLVSDRKSLQALLDLVAAQAVPRSVQLDHGFLTTSALPKTTGARCKRVRSSFRDANSAFSTIIHPYAACSA